MDILESNITAKTGRKRKLSEGSLRRRSQPNSTQYVVVRADDEDSVDKLPKKWKKNMHLGCKKTKNGKYKCCKAPVGSPGCRKRYKCCGQDVRESMGTHMRTTSGCKIGWGC